jgi:hypothetical protein
MSNITPAQTQKCFRAHTIYSQQQFTPHAITKGAVIPIVHKTRICFVIIGR